MVGDTLRYIGLGRQADQGTDAATIHYLSSIEDFTHKPNIKKEVPRFKTNRRNMKLKGYTQTRTDEITIKGQIDSTEFGWILDSGAGPPTGPTANRWSWIFGQAQQRPVTAANSMYLTVVFGEGLDMSWKMIDGRISKMSIKYEATGKLSFEATIVGLIVTNEAQIDPTLNPPADNTPFHPWQATLAINGDTACVVSFEFTMDNHYEPFYCSPAALPEPGDPHGLTPKRFTEGEADGKWSAVVEFTDDSYITGQPYYDAERDITENWVLTAWDADTDLGGGIHPEFKLTLPRTFGDTPEIDRSKPNVLQSCKGDLLEDSGIGGPASAELVNALGSYNGD